MRINYTFSAFIVFCVLGLWACSQENNSLLSKAYHNTTAYYNAYFLADERMGIVDEKIRENNQDDYNRVLPVFMPMDTAFNSSLKDDLDYAGKKASFPVQFHKNSKWVDDSYLLLGQVRLYQNKPDLAIQTFRYVNYKSEDEPTRHQALYWLIRIYMDQKQHTQALDVVRYLESKELDPKNERDFHLTMAYYHQKLNENKEALKHLELAVPKIKGDRDLKSRTNFITAQLHQSFGNDSLAYAYYKTALKGTPPYELTFFTKLNMAQVSSVNDKTELKKIKKYFVKLLKDLKNEEYRDRIYYEMAKFDLKQGRSDSAFANITRSIKAESANPHQKGYTYWLAGKTRFKQKKYLLAQAYYDSTFSNIKEDFLEYKEIKERREILNNFVEHYTIVETQDSLQRLAKMDSVALSTYLDEVVKKEEERLRKEAEQAKEEAKKKKEKEKETPLLANKNAEFIFYNPMALANSNVKFIDRWGNRPLEDNWRRSNKESTFDDIPEEESPVEEIVEEEKSKEEDELVIKVDKSKYYRDIPFTEKALAESNEKKKHALFQLGKIYDLQLEEDLDAIESFQCLQKEFPGSEYEAETAYFLYLLCEKTGKCSTEEPKQLLLTTYPNSIYAKKVLNPNYAQDNESVNKQSHRAYEKAYNTFVRGNYLSTQQQLSALLKEYPITDIKDKIVFLKILTYAKLDQFVQYQEQLIQFQDDFKTSPLVPEAIDLLKYLKARKGELKAVKNKFELCSDSTVHYFVGMFSYEEITKEEMMSFFDDFRETYYPTKKFELRHVAFNQESYIITIKSFENKPLSKEYLKKLKHFTEFKGTLKKKNYQFLLFSDQNYQVFIHNKQIDEYSKFYKTHY